MASIAKMVSQSKRSIARSKPHFLSGLLVTMFSLSHVLNGEAAVSNCGTVHALRMHVANRVKSAVSTAVSAAVEVFGEMADLNGGLDREPREPVDVLGEVITRESVREPVAASDESDSGEYDWADFSQFQEWRESGIRHDYEVLQQTVRNHVALVQEKHERNVAIYLEEQSKMNESYTHWFQEFAIEVEQGRIRPWARRNSMKLKSLQDYLKDCGTPAECRKQMNEDFSEWVADKWVAELKLPLYEWLKRPLYDFVQKKLAEERTIEGDWKVETQLNDDPFRFKMKPLHFRRPGLSDSLNPFHFLGEAEEKLANIREEKKRLLVLAKKGVMTLLLASQHKDNKHIPHQLRDPLSLVADVVARGLHE